MNSLFLFFICLLSQFYLFAGLEEHFKPAGFKPPYWHQIRNIDFIYMINLDERPEKFNLSCEQLEPWGIYPYRFSAVNGWKLPLEAINDVGIVYQPWMKKNIWGTAYLTDDMQPHHEIMNTVGRTYFVHCMSRGAIGIALSHLSVLQDAYDSGYETIWVMEDDIHVIDEQNPHLISDLIDELDHLVGPDQWDVLYTDRDMVNKKGEPIVCTSYAPRPDIDPTNPSRFTKRIPLSETFSQVGARYGAHSMIIRRSGIEKLLHYFKTNKIFLPYDMDNIFPESIRYICLEKDLISNLPNALTDNGQQGYKKKKNNP